jgi:hypothetical protein
MDSFNELFFQLGSEANRQLMAKGTDLKNRSRDQTPVELF